MADACLILSSKMYLQWNLPCLDEAAWSEFMPSGSRRSREDSLRSFSLLFVMKYRQSHNREARILSPLRSLDQNDMTICFPGPKPKHSHQFGLGKHNRRSVLLFGTPWQRRGFYSHTQAWVILGLTRHYVDPRVSRAVVRHGEVRRRSRTDLFCLSPERTAETHTPPIVLFSRSRLGIGQRVDRPIYCGGGGEETNRGWWKRIRECGLGK